MGKRLLFVDDEPLLLNGLRRALHGTRDQWDMSFVDGAAAALNALDKEHFDAVISDMRMPGMDGAELLDLVKERHPNLIRIVLSGQASRASVLRSIAPAHQFLSKPCDPGELIGRLRQAFAMQDMLANDSLRIVISRLRSIPSLPAIYEELITALRTDDPSVTHIERIISKDVSMAAKILQLANSAFIGSCGRVTNLTHAISLIGIETVRLLVLSVHVSSQFDSTSELTPHVRGIWDHSLATAGLARQIAIIEKCTKAVIEESFTAGLLHDIGRVVLLAETPQQYAPILAETDLSRTVALELERFGCTHAQVGAYLMSIWGLPVPLVRAVAFHHCPFDGGESQFSSLTAVHAADAICSASDQSPAKRDGDLNVDYLQQLRLQARVDVWRALYEANKLTKPMESA